MAFHGARRGAPLFEPAFPSGGQRQLDLRILQRFSEAWASAGKWRFSLLDGKLDIQEYNVYHNMGSWYLGVGAFVRKNGNKNEFGLGISFYHPADRGLYAGQIPLMSGKDTVFCEVFPGSFFLFRGFAF